MATSIYRPINSFKDIEIILRQIDKEFSRRPIQVSSVPRDADGDQGDMRGFFDSRLRDSRRVYIKPERIAWQRLTLRPNSMILVGENLVEGTTTSITNVDLVTVATENLLETESFLIVGVIRKTAGAANNVQFGLKLNATVVMTAYTAFGAANAAASGLIRIWVGPRLTNYLRCGDGRMMTGDGTIQEMSFTGDAPQATITSVTITGQTNDAAITAGVNYVRVYKVPTM